MAASCLTFQYESTKLEFWCRLWAQIQSYCLIKVKVTLRLTVSLSWWVTWSDIRFSLTVTVLSLWGALSEERTGLSIARIIFSSNMLVVRMYNIFTFYMLHMLVNVYTICIYICCLIEAFIGRPTYGFRANKQISVCYNKH
jgi:hypothetical protein